MDAVTEIRRSKWDRFGGWATLLALVLVTVPVIVTGLRSGPIVRVGMGSAFQQGGAAALAKRDYWLLSGASGFAGVWIALGYLRARVRVVDGALEVRNRLRTIESSISEIAAIRVVRGRVDIIPGVTSRISWPGSRPYLAEVAMSSGRRVRLLATSRDSAAEVVALLAATPLPSPVSKQP